MGFLKTNMLLMREIVSYLKPLESIWHLNKMILTWESFYLYGFYEDEDFYTIR